MNLIFVIVGVSNSIPVSYNGSVSVRLKQIPLYSGSERKLRHVLRDVVVNLSDVLRIESVREIWFTVIIKISILFFNFSEMKILVFWPDFRKSRL